MLQIKFIEISKKGLTVNDFVKVLVHTALDGTQELALDSTTKSLDSTKKSLIEQKLSKHDESNIDRTNLETWIRNLDKIKVQWSPKFLIN